MGCTKVTDAEFVVVCPCGFEQRYALEDENIQLYPNTIVLPVCIECKEKQVSLNVVELPAEYETQVSPENVKRHKVNQTLFKRLLARGKAVRAENIDEEKLVLSLAVKSGTVEAPLHSMIQEAKNIKENPNYLKEKAAARAREQELRLLALAEQEEQKQKKETTPQ